MIIKIYTYIYMLYEIDENYGEEAKKKQQFKDKKILKTH